MNTMNKNTNTQSQDIQLMSLSYSAQDLKPVISEQTISFHHGKHHQTYVDNLRGLLENSPLKGLPLEEIVKKSDGAIASNAGQVYNHNMYFEQFAPATHSPVGEMNKLIDKQFGSFEAFQKEFEQAGASLFGSGWVWLSLGTDGALHISKLPNAGTPLTEGHKPLLTFDVWEHAYYLDYQNRRAAYLHELWQIVDWNLIEKRLKA